MNDNLTGIQGNVSLDPEKAMFPISTIANILQVHQRTLRIYDKENLLTPSRSIKNRRLYSFNDVERGKFIKFLTGELGINLAGVKIIFYLLFQQNIDPIASRKHIKDIAEKLNISSEIQLENKLKQSRKGRKPRITN
ncbi:MAG: MerR family transcriptional regulator [uncultured bacterium]|nr:MAG: MerR family transcriptional regulator [uncultured bacterium]